MASDATGSSSWQALSESFGHTFELSGKRTRMNLRFAGQYFDEETGTNYNYQRDYSPGLGRYLQNDPIGLDGGVNIFVYVEANPLKYFDFNGLGKGERGYGRGPNSTDNPGKHWKDDPKKPGWGWQKDPQSGKPTYKKRPPWLPPIKGLGPLFCPLCEYMPPPEPPVGPELC